MFFNNSNNMIFDIKQITNEFPKNIRSQLYDYHINNTHVFYKKVLTKLPENSRILEVGIGNGTCIQKNAELIKDKKLHIDGIDIDNDYLKICNDRIIENDLQDYVTAKYQDLLTLQPPDNRYDYIFFMESYPVIPIDIMRKMMNKCSELLKPNTGVISFVHNLVSTKNPVVDFIKPRLLYVPFIQVDFGRLTSHDEFDDFLLSAKYKANQKSLLETVDVASHYKVPLPNFINNFHKMEQYYIECVPL
jgi:cyclopropane fatty-acyl-phospholipid synthase-like methyltransferase